MTVAEILSDYYLPFMAFGAACFWFGRKWEAHK
jgi:hypothetical protein